MPEGRRAPWKFLPRPGARLSVTFGAPLSPAAVHATMAPGMGSWRDGEGMQQQQSGQVRVEMEAGAAEVRIALTKLVQRAVEDLGRQVSGDLLTGPPPHHHEQRI